MAVKVDLFQYFCKVSFLVIMEMEESCDFFCNFTKVFQEHVTTLHTLCSLVYKMQMLSVLEFDVPVCYA